MGHQAASVSWSRVVKTLGSTVVGFGLVAVSLDAMLGWLVPVALGGGAVVAAMLLLLDSRNGHSISVVDRFGRDDVDNIMNMSRVRVAGIGGAGLVLMAGALAVQYELIGVALMAGLLGGALAGLLLIVARKPSSTSTA